MQLWLLLQEGALKKFNIVTYVLLKMAISFKNMFLVYYLIAIPETAVYYCQSQKIGKKTFHFVN